VSVLGLNWSPDSAMRVNANPDPCFYQHEKITIINDLFIEIAIKTYRKKKNISRKKGQEKTNIMLIWSKKKQKNI
jgi:hypothetical protein